MCQRHSFLLDKEGRVYDGGGLTHSHTEIATMHGLTAEQSDALNAYEWQPPADWPKSSWLSGLTVDRQNFEPKSSHDKAMKAYLLGRFPTQDAWDAPESIDPSLDGQTVTLASGEFVVLLSGKHTDLSDGRRYLLAGGVSVRGVSGSTRLFLRGNASVSDVGDNASVSSVWGNASVSGVGGNASVSDVGDNASVSSVWGNASVSNVWGNASVSSVWGNASVSNVWGNASVSGLADRAVFIDRYNGGLTVFAAMPVDVVNVTAL